MKKKHCLSAALFFTPVLLHAGLALNTSFFLIPFILHFWILNLIIGLIEFFLLYKKIGFSKKREKGLRVLLAAGFVALNYLLSYLVIALMSGLYLWTGSGIFDIVRIHPVHENIACGLIYGALLFLLKTLLVMLVLKKAITIGDFLKRYAVLQAATLAGLFCFYLLLYFAVAHVF